MSSDQILLDARAAQKSGNPAEAEKLYRAALEVLPDHADANRFLGILLLDRGEAAEAALCFSRALAQRPDQPSYHQNYAMALAALADWEGRLAACERALRLKPDYALALYNRGEALLQLSRYDEAIVSFQRSLAMGLRDPRPYFAMATAYYMLHRFGEAMTNFDTAYAHDPDMPGLKSKRLFCAQRICRWSDFDREAAALIAEVEHANPQVEPFHVLALPSTSAQQKICAEKYAAENCPPRPAIHKRDRSSGRIRIAYLSKDFTDHPVTFLIAEVLERHDRAAFEIFAASHGTDKECGGRNRIKKAAEHFIELQTLNDPAAAQALADLDIDIAVDLDGYTLDARPGILAHRPARVQVNYLGYPGTMGASHIDYLIGDGIVTPPEHAAYFTEKLVQLPGCYLPSSARPVLREVPGLSRASCGLPEDGIVFCAFNNSYKIRAQIFSQWMQLLAQVPGSVLWLRDDVPAVIGNLRREAAGRGVDPARLVFSSFVGAKEHFARMALADMFLDTTPYNAHTTAGDALWAGIPVITLLGDTFAGRVAASLLAAAGLDEFIARSPADYDALALSLAKDPVKLAAAKQRVKTAQGNSTLFDAAHFTRQLESAYRQMQARQQAGKAPEGFAVQA